MGTNMKTTIDIADNLLDQARAVAADEGITVRSLVEEGLRLTLDRHQEKSGFSLRRASFKGKGSSPACLSRIGTWCVASCTRVVASDSP